MGARGARAIPSRLKKRGELEKDETYARTRTYANVVQSTDARISAAHTQCVDTRTYACTYVRVAGGAVRTSVSRGRTAPTISIRARSH